MKNDKFKLALLSFGIICILRLTFAAVVSVPSNQKASKALTPLATKR